MLKRTRPNSRKFVTPVMRLCWIQTDCNRATSGPIIQRLLLGLQTNNHFLITAYDLFIPQ